VQRLIPTGRPFAQAGVSRVNNGGNHALRIFISGAVFISLTVVLMEQYGSVEVKDETQLEPQPCDQSVLYVTNGGFAATNMAM
jgi:hypothetical protein